jgi:hypothetical protein
MGRVNVGLVGYSIDCSRAIDCMGSVNVNAVSGFNGAMASSREVERPPGMA